LPQYKFNEHYRDKNADDRINDVHDIVELNIEAGSKQVLDKVYGIFNDYGSQPAQKPYNHTQHHHKLTVVEVLPLQVIDVNQQAVQGFHFQLKIRQVNLARSKRFVIKGNMIRLELTQI
jgi:hypothetical protein